MAHTGCEMVWLQNLLIELVSNSVDPCLCIVTISLPSILPRTQCFMKGANTLRSIVTLSEMLGPRK